MAFAACGQVSAKSYKDIRATENAWRSVVSPLLVASV